MAATNNENSERRVVPRWRSFREALATEELATGLNAPHRALEGREFLAEREGDWNVNRELPFAVDFVCAALVLGITPAAEQAAEVILESKTASVLAKRLASRLLGIEKPTGEKESGSNLPDQIKHLKACRLQQPRNAFIWADLARLYVLLGQTSSAERALAVAYTLAPNDRFILRCITRFYLHTKEPERALNLLRGTARASCDPWLIAAEIAVSSVLEKTPRLTGVGQAVLKSGNFQPFHISELASALGSLEMFSGRDKRAGKLFALSLADPTDNALAQVVWASNKISFGRVNENLLKIPRAFEAKTFDAFNRKSWEDLLGNAQAWTNDEAFSSRPRVLASAIAASLLDKAQFGEKIARDGLATNPGHPGLINNIAFALIQQGKPNEALEIITKADVNQMTRTDGICLMATTGLAYFRLGNSKDGEDYYRSAIEAACRTNEDALKILATLYLSRERVKLGEKGAFSEFRKAKESALKQPRTTLPDIAAILEKDVMSAEMENRVK